MNKKRLMTNNKGKQAIFNNGTLEITNGNLNSTALYGTINNYVGGLLVINGANLSGKNRAAIYYDGTIKGVTDAISGTITNQEQNTQIVVGSDVIGGKTYITNHLEENN